MFVKNSSVRTWLSGRRGFKPTKYVSDSVTNLENICSPSELASYLVKQREKIGLDLKSTKIAPLHASIDSLGIVLLESGSFKLPLDAVFPLADIYQINREELLGAVMRVFFSDELKVIKDIQ